MGAKANGDGLAAGAQLTHVTPLSKVRAVLWFEGHLYCACDELSEPGKPYESPKLGSKFAKIKKKLHSRSQKSQEKF